MLFKSTALNDYYNFLQSQLNLRRSNCLCLKDFCYVLDSRRTVVSVLFEAFQESQRDRSSFEKRSSGVEVVLSQSEDVHLVRRQSLLLRLQYLQRSLVRKGKN